MKIGILKTDDVRSQWVDKYGEYSDMFIELLRSADPALTFVVYEVQHGQYPASIDDVDAYIITGSKRSVYEDIPWIHQLAEFVRTLAAAQKKLVGVCFGHQLIAHALGGKTEKSDKGWGVGRHTVRLSDRALKSIGGEQDFNLLVSHQDQVTIPAKGAEVLATSDFCSYAICQIGNHILSFQGHPEFNVDYSRELLNLRVDKYSRQCYQQGIDSLELPLDTQRAAQWIVDFIREPKTSETITIN
ncbi:MAG: GMP synthase [Spongiibacteraceae bacterium]